MRTSHPTDFFVFVIVFSSFFLSLYIFFFLTNYFTHILYLLQIFFPKSEKRGAETNEKSKNDELERLRVHSKREGEKKHEKKTVEEKGGGGNENGPWSNYSH